MGHKYSLCFDSVGSTVNKIQNEATEQATLTLQTCYYKMLLFTPTLLKKLLLIFLITGVLYS